MPPPTFATVCAAFATPPRGARNRATTFEPKSSVTQCAVKSTGVLNSKVFAAARLSAIIMPSAPTEILAASEDLLNVNAVTPASKFRPSTEYAFATFHAPAGSSAEKLTVSRPVKRASTLARPVQLARFSGSSSAEPVHVAESGTT